MTADENTLVWRPLARPELGLTNSISDQIHQLETMKPGCITDVRCSRSLVVASDYSGHHRGSKYECYSFLVGGLDYLWLWLDERDRMRTAYLPDGRRMSYKGLNDGVKRKALGPFLSAANWIPGCLCSFIVDKKLASLFKRGCKVVTGDYSDTDYRHWNTRVLERALRVANFGALLLAGMSGPMQDVMWFSHQDDIASGAVRVTETCKLLARVSSHYLPHSLRHFRFGSSESDDGSKAIEDLIAIPDLAAGALTDLAPGLCAAKEALSAPPVFTPMEITAKASLILDWVFQNQYSLKKLIIRLYMGHEGQVRYGCDSPGL